MDDQQLIIRFEGASAKHHVMGMRDLGESLKGIERILTTGIYAMRAGRYPNTNARLPFSVLVSSPRQGSVEFVALWESVGPILPLLPEVYLSGVPEAVRNWLIGVLLKMGGREDQSSKHLSEVLSIMEQVEGNRHLEIIALLDREHERTRRYAKQAVTAVGPSCDKLVIPSIIEVAEIDIAIAEVIRSGDDLEVSDMETMRVLVDGFIHHSKQIKLHHPTKVALHSSMITSRCQRRSQQYHPSFPGRFGDQNQVA